MLIHNNVSLLDIGHFELNRISINTVLLEIKLSTFNVELQMIKQSLLIIRRSLSILINQYYSTKKLSKIDSSVQTNTLNDKKQYEKTLGLFRQNSSSVTDVSINQALKACTKQRDLQRGKIIHQQLSSSSLENPFIRCSLLYSSSNRFQNSQALTISKIDLFLWFF